jgi:hypothetical protein
MNSPPWARTPRPKPAERIVHLLEKLVSQGAKILSTLTDFQADVKTISDDVSSISADVSAVKDFVVALQAAGAGVITQAQLDQAVVDLTAADTGLKAADVALKGVVTPPAPPVA